MRFKSRLTGERPVGSYRDQQSDVKKDLGRWKQKLDAKGKFGTSNAYLTFPVFNDNVSNSLA